MPTAQLFQADGKSTDYQLAPEIFDVQVNVPVLHEVVRAQLLAARAGTHSTKTRGEVRGGGRKPWRQKGTGRARHGSIREPQWVGGGVAHGPKPRDHSVRVNRKTRALALRSALTDRARDSKVIVVEIPEFDEPDTKRAVEMLEKWGAEGNVLFVASRSEEQSLTNVWKSFRNLPDVLTVSYPTAYTVMAADFVIFTPSALSDLSAPLPPDESDASSAGTVGGLAPGPGSHDESDAVPRGSAAGLARASEGEDEPAEDLRALRDSSGEESSPSTEREPDAEPPRAGSREEQ